jgi:hypothetical protein
MGCRPFPRYDWAALDFVPALRDFVRSGKVRLAAQNIRHSLLAREHFGLKDLPPVVGLWTQDMNDVFNSSDFESRHQIRGQQIWDVLFHGHGLPAKGVEWVMELAVASPELKFLFPFACPEDFRAPSNCTFLPLSWERGLRAEIERSKFVIVPSLWSAPIEGSLVKSIAIARAVLVVENGTSFSREIPNSVVLHLSPNIVTASLQLNEACLGCWAPDIEARARWLQEFSSNKEEFAVRLLTCVLSD